MVGETDCAIIIQARNTSTRLPGKATVDINGWTPVEIMARRLRGWPIVWALPEEDASADIMVRIPSNHLVYFGSVDDLADRRWQAAQLIDAKYYALLGADDFLIDPTAVNHAFLAATGHRHQYVQTVGYPLGCNAQVVSHAYLHDAYEHAVGDEREHLVLYFDRRPKQYPAYRYHRYPDVNGYRITLDTVDDYRLMDHLVTVLGYDATTDQMVEFLDTRPLWKVTTPHIVPEGTPIVTGGELIKVGHIPSLGDL